MNFFIFYVQVCGGGGVPYGIKNVFILFDIPVKLFLEPL